MKTYTLVKGTYHGIEYRGLIWGSLAALGESIYFVQLLEPIEINGRERSKIAIVEGDDTIEPMIREEETEWQVDIPKYQEGDEADEWTWNYATQEEAIAAAVHEHFLTQEKITVIEKVKR